MKIKIISYVHANEYNIYNKDKYLGNVYGDNHILNRITNVLTIMNKDKIPISNINDVMSANYYSIEGKLL